MKVGEEINFYGYFVTKTQNKKYLKDLMVNVYHNLFKTCPQFLSDISCMLFQTCRNLNANFFNVCCKQ